MSTLAQCVPFQTCSRLTTVKASARPLRTATTSPMTKSTLIATSKAQHLALPTTRSSRPGPRPVPTVSNALLMPHHPLTGSSTEISQF